MLLDDNHERYVGMYDGRADILPLSKRPDTNTTIYAACLSGIPVVSPECVYAAPDLPGWTRYR